MSQFHKDYFRFKSIRDPLYGFIDISKIEIRLIDSEYFRRLQSIKQLSHAYVVYPSAIHTRFEHSLGALYVVDRMCSQLNYSPERKEIIRIAMLLHDIGHGPFSHLFEKVLEKVNGKPIDHADISQWIINEDPEIKEILGIKTKKVIQLLEKNDHAAYWNNDISLDSDLISSSIDADKLDYLRRDSYHIGVAYGSFDLARIIHTLRRSPKRDRVCIDRKGMDAVENYRLGRYLMHAQVYEHHARLVADLMFLKALDLAINEEKIIQKKILRIDSSSHKKFLDFYKKLDDRSLYDLILQHPRSKAAKILSNIKRRKLLKRACEFDLKEIVNSIASEKILKMDTNSMSEMSEDIAKIVKVKPEEIIVHMSSITLKLYDRRDILVLWKNEPRDLNSFSPISAESKVMKFYVFGPLEKRESIARAVSKYLNVPLNIIKVTSK